MPPLYYLNPPPHPFWDFVSSIEDHPFFGTNTHGPQGPQGPPHGFHGPRGPHAHHAHRAAPAPPPASQPAPEMSEKAQGKQPQCDAEDPPEVDPATVKPSVDEPQKCGPGNESCGRGRAFPFRGRGRFAGVFNEDENSAQPGRGDHPCRGRGRPGRMHGPPGAAGMPPFFGGPWFARHGPPHGMHPHPPPPGSRGGHAHAHAHAHAHPHPHPHHGHHGPFPPSAPHSRPAGFDLNQFLQNLGERLGVDLNGVSEGLGLNRSDNSRSNDETDFEPRADIFENKDQYTVHISLPGARKEDVGVDWDGEKSLLRVTGVVHRPGVDEQMMSELVVDGRKRETGLFEKCIRLGTKRDPASIDVTGIHAKMADGVLIIRIPKDETSHHRRDVPITSVSQRNTPSPVTDIQPSTTIFDADHQMLDALATESDKAEPRPRSRSETVQPDPSFDRSTTHHLVSSLENSSFPTLVNQDTLDESKKQDEINHDTQSQQDNAKALADDVSKTEQHASEESESDWEKYSDEDDNEADYVKINVD